MIVPLFVEETDNVVVWSVVEPAVIERREEIVDLRVIFWPQWRHVPAMSVIDVIPIGKYKLVLVSVTFNTGGPLLVCS